MKITNLLKVKKRTIKINKHSNKMTTSSSSEEQIFSKAKIFSAIGVTGAVLITVSSLFTGAITIPIGIGALLTEICTIASIFDLADKSLIEDVLEIAEELK